jgi:hypothetical protein
MPGLEAVVAVRLQGNRGARSAEFIPPLHCWPSCQPGGLKSAFQSRPCPPQSAEFIPPPHCLPSSQPGGLKSALQSLHRPRRSAEFIPPRPSGIGAIRTLSVMRTTSRGRFVTSKIIRPKRGSCVIRRHGNGAVRGDGMNTSGCAKRPVAERGIHSAPAQRTTPAAGAD